MPIAKDSHNALLVQVHQGSCDVMAERDSHGWVQEAAVWQARQLATVKLVPKSPLHSAARHHTKQPGVSCVVCCNPLVCERLDLKATDMSAILTTHAKPLEKNCTGKAL
jgi:hypothetical protein